MQGKQSAKKRLVLPLFVGCGGLLFLILLAGGIFLYAGWLGYQEAPKMVEGQQPGAQLQDPYVLTAAQEEVVVTYGYPEGFSILFYEEEARDATLQDVRLETWDYYSQRKGFTFINGELTGEDILEIPELKTLEPLPYFPEQFGAYMTLEQVLAASGLDTYVEIPLEKAFLEDAEVYYGEALTFGIKDGELRYIEALALSAGE